MQKLRAFTLIELLVVIAIIGILSGFVAVSMSGATNAAKDAKRKADIDTIRKAVLLYSIQNGGVYPVESSCNVGSNCSTLATALVPNYIPVLPIDPNAGTYYTYTSNGSDFTTGSDLSNSTNYSYTASTGFSSGASGSCGPANGHYRSSIPTGADLCSAGTASAVSGSGPWSWSCGLTSCSTVVATYVVTPFTTVGSTTWTVPAGVTSVSYLIVAGGGAGGTGANLGGGGGAGGLLYAADYSVTPAAVLNVVVGAGGTGTETNGGNSSFNGIIATGGGRGGTHSSGPDASSGGSGGGGSYVNTTPGSGIAGPPRQGYGGGTGGYPCNGGGGGAGGVGANGSGGGSPVCGVGGVGLDYSSVFGTSVGANGWFAGGGGGGDWGGPCPAGGNGGGGTGGTNTGGCGNGTSGMANTGGGGGNGYAPPAKTGGSGVVIVKYVSNF